MIGPLNDLLRLLLVCVLLGWGTSGEAQTKASWIAVLRTSSPDDEALASRAQGQLSDLPVELRVRPGPAPGPSAVEQWRAAVELAGSESARVVLWFDQEPDAIGVHLAEPATRRLFFRRVRADTRQGGMGRSALSEAAALVVRSALKALEAGRQLGEDVPEELEPPPAPEEEPPPLPSAPPPEAPLLAEAPPLGPPASITPIREAEWVLAVGWQAAVDGSSPQGQQGPQVSVGWEAGRLRARVLVLASLPAALLDEHTRVSLSRHTVGGGIGGSVSPTKRLRLGVDLGVGVAGFLRSTVALGPGVIASPARLTLAPYVSPELSARWRSGPVALEASLAVDVLAGVPSLGYLRGEEFIPRAPLWVAQPRFGLAILVGAP